MLVCLSVFEGCMLTCVPPARAPSVPKTTTVVLPSVGPDVGSENGCSGGRW
tara:strand:- start:182 stop:334 length:153 start_codon:yes stop_codon:yes gene_type:complete